ncbi:MAG: hypothetical protein P8X85_19430 [Desulfobacterales bacterium]
MPLYNEVKGDLADTRNQLDDAQRQLDDLRAKQAESEVQLQWMELALSKSEARNSQFSK